MVVISRRAALDVAAVAALAVVDVIVSWDRTAGGSMGVVLPVAAVGYLPLLWRRRYPVQVFALVLAHSVGTAFAGIGYVPTLAVLFALYTVAVRVSGVPAWLALLAAFGPTGLSVAQEVSSAAPADRVDAMVGSAVLGSMLNVAVFGVGRWVGWSLRQRRLVARLSAEEAASAERGRIAREMHDVVAHSVTLMVLQAAGAASVLRSEPARAEAALRHVDDIGRLAVTQLHELLGVLSGDDGRSGMEPGLADLEGLVGAMSAAGLTVDVRVEGDLTTLARRTDETAYRIVQEALTNAARYADLRHPVQLRLLMRPDELVIEVCNRRGHSRRPLPSTGRGLPGMRERGRAVGGTVTAGPAPGDAFLVSARLPCVAPDRAVYAG
jgi:signal transduction histidine kinase